MSNTQNKEYWEDGVLRMKVAPRTLNQRELPCPEDIEEKDFHGLHMSAQVLLLMRNRKPMYNAWEKK